MILPILRILTPAKDGIAKVVNDPRRYPLIYSTIRRSEHHDISTSRTAEPIVGLVQPNHGLFYGVCGQIAMPKRVICEFVAIP